MKIDTTRAKKHNLPYMANDPLKIIQGDAWEVLKTLPSESVHCCVTSPPYWGLRDYGTASWEGGDTACDHKRFNGYPSGLEGGKEAQDIGKLFKDTCGKCGAKRIDSQLGLEKTPEEYVAKMVEVFREVRRVLRNDGTLWMNMGDSYATQGGKQPDDAEWKASQVRASDRGYDVGGWGACRNKTQGAAGRAANTAVSGLKPKDLCGIPWRLAFALQADGWWLRSDIIWHKPNPMPESCTDRPTKSHEYLFLLTKSSSYFYDAEAIKEQGGDGSDRWGGAKMQLDTPKCLGGDDNGQNRPMRTFEYNGTRNKRSVWTVATAPYPEAHFATYPPNLIKPCILAGTSAKGCCAKCGAPWERQTETSYDDSTERGEHEKYNGKDAGFMTNPGLGRATGTTKTTGWQHTCKCEGNPATLNIACTVLDPFAGSGTTGQVALELGRKAILIELNPKYVELIKRRCDVTPGLQLA